MKSYYHSFWTLVLVASLSLLLPGCSQKAQEEPDDVDDVEEEIDDNPTADLPNVNYSTAEPIKIQLLKTKEEYDAFIADNEIAVVKFGATWCQPCQALGKELPKLAGYFHTTSARFAEVDVDVLPKVAESLAIGTIPDTRIFYNGSQYAQMVGNEPSSIANLVESMCQNVVEVADVQVAKPAANDAEEKIESIEPSIEAQPNDVKSEEKNKVRMLHSEEEYDQFISENQFAVVKFGATWCGPCRALAPELEKQAAQFEADGVVFAEVDVDELGELSEKAGISGIPDVRIFIDGEEVDKVVGNMPQKIADKIAEQIGGEAENDSDEEEGDSDAEDFDSDEEEGDLDAEDFDSDEEGDDSDEESKVLMLHSEEEYDQFISENQFAVVKFGATWCGPCQELAPKLEDQAAQFEVGDVVFAEVDIDELEELSEKMGVSGIPDVRIFENGEEVDRVVGNDPYEIGTKISELCGVEYVPDPEDMPEVDEGFLEDQLWGDEDAASADATAESDVPSESDAEPVAKESTEPSVPAANP